MKDFVNTVPAAAQMVNATCVSFLGNEAATNRILVLGNSITRHGPKDDIGWPYDHGMAASAPEKDYVHRLYAKLTESGREVYMRIRQAADWERGMREADRLSSFEGEKEFGADLILFRLGENVPKEDVCLLSDAIRELMAYLARAGTKVLFTTCFWHHPERNDAIRAAAASLAAPVIDITCESESQMAIGLFAHSGVAGHPGDAGMEMIAHRLFGAIQNQMD